MERESQRGGVIVACGNEAASKKRVHDESVERLDPGLWLSSKAIAGLSIRGPALNLAELSDEREACAGYRAIGASVRVPQVLRPRPPAPAPPVYLRRRSVCAHSSDDTRTRHTWKAVA